MDGYQATTDFKYCWVCETSPGSPSGSTSKRTITGPNSQTLNTSINTINSSSMDINPLPSDFKCCWIRRTSLHSPLDSTSQGPGLDPTVKQYFPAKSECGSKRHPGQPVPAQNYRYGHPKSPGENTEKRLNSTYLYVFFIFHI